MRMYLMTVVTLLFFGTAFGQFKLDVKGDSRIDGRLEIDDGRNSVFIGQDAGVVNTFGSSNVFIGDSTGLKNTFGIDNVFVGRKAGLNNTDGIQNVYIGNNAGRSNDSGDFNTFVGEQAGEDCTVGDNTFIGEIAGRNTTIGTQNTFVGRGAGQFNIDGNTLTAFGFSSTASITGSEDNAFAFGANSIARGSHTGVLGNVATQQISGYTNFASASDGRMKQGVKENVPGLAFIQQLRPVTYHYDAQKIDQHLRQSLPNPKDQLETSADYKKALQQKSKIRYTGFIAQEVEQAAKDLGFDFSGVVPPTSKADHYSLRYAEFVVPLVKATQEQQQEIETQQAYIESLETKVEKMETRLAALEGLISAQTIKQNNKSTTAQLKTTASLNQNTPNPFNGITTISYFIPEKVTQAILQITDINGKVIKRVDIAESGHGILEIDATRMQTGQYFYGLILDGQVFESKQMLLAK